MVHHLVEMTDYLMADLKATMKVVKLDDLRVAMLDDLMVVTTVPSKDMQMALLRVVTLVLMKVAYSAEKKVEH